MTGVQTCALPISIANALFLWIIEFFGYEEPMGNLPPLVNDDIILGVMVGFALVPAVALMFAFAFMWFYNLEGPEWQKKKQKISQIHQQKEKEYLKMLNQALGKDQL